MSLFFATNSRFHMVRSQKVTVPESDFFEEVLIHSISQAKEQPSQDARRRGGRLAEACERACHGPWVLFYHDAQCLMPMSYALCPVPCVYPMPAVPPLCRHAARVPPMPPCRQLVPPCRQQCRHNAATPAGGIANLAHSDVLLSRRFHSGSIAQIHPL